MLTEKQQQSVDSIAKRIYSESYNPLHLQALTPAMESALKVWCRQQDPEYMENSTLWEDTFISFVRSFNKNIDTHE